MSLVDLIYWATAVFVTGYLTGLGIKAVTYLPFFVGRR